MANSTGYIVTAGHCVDNQNMAEGGKAAIVDAQLIRNVERHVISEAEANRMWSEIMTRGKVEGETSGSPPERLVTVFEPSGSTGTASAALTAASGMTANVVDFKSLDNGDVGLLKVRPSSPLPALQVAGGSPEVGSEVISAGYPGAVASVVDPNQQPSFKSGTVSSMQTVSGVPFIETNADNVAGMSGGPTVDLQGRVLGTVSFGPAEEEQSFNFITDTSVLKSMLARNGVPTTLSAADRAYRAGLNDYFAGRYHGAVAQFDKVLAAEPGQALAADYRAKAIARYPLEASGFPWVWVGIGIGALILLGAGVTALLIDRRRRARPIPVAAGPAPGPSPAAGSGLPVPPPASGEMPRTGQAAAGTEPPTAPSEVPARSGTRGRDLQSQPTTGVYCPNCGTPHSAEARFCVSCGQALRESDSGRMVGQGGRASSSGR